MDRSLNIREGQNIKIIQKVIEGKRERNIPFTGKVIKVRGIGVNKTITVKQTLEGIDVERIFPIASPTISQMQIIEEKKRETKARKRAKKK